MNTELIDTFLDLVETRSFHRSAERLGAAQSTISARLVTLEDIVGARLFTRSRAGADLTTEGLKFESHARALRHAWREAQRAVAASGTKALTLRIGIQHDLATGARGQQIGTWIAAFRRALPDCAFYIEPDYSAQMCHDIARGSLDFAVIYTPQSHADLHLATVGEVRYRLVASTGDKRRELAADTYIRAAFSPAFDAAHSAALPEMVGAALASGQNAAMEGMLIAMGGAGFVSEDSARAMVAAHGFAYVRDVAPITQPVFGVMNLRHRTSGMHKRLTQIVQRELAAVRA
ncbi:MAG: LysR family transcriptional regulator [Cypionkella sp.]|nr:LysR family transcriptional regulator [Cypionkella sp.]